MTKLDFEEMQCALEIIDRDIYQSELDSEYECISFTDIDSLTFYLNRAKLRDKLNKAMRESK